MNRNSIYICYSVSCGLETVDDVGQKHLYKLKINIRTMFSTKISLEPQLGSFKWHVETTKNVSFEHHKTIISIWSVTASSTAGTWVSLGDNKTLYRLKMRSSGLMITSKTKRSWGFSLHGVREQEKEDGHGDGIQSQHMRMRMRFHFNATLGAKTMLEFEELEIYKRGKLVLVLI